MNLLRNLMGLENNVRNTAKAVPKNFMMGLQPNVVQSPQQVHPQPMQVPRAIQNTRLMSGYSTNQMGNVAEPLDPSVYYHNRVPLMRAPNANSVNPLQSYAYKLGTDAQPMFKLPLL